MKEKLMLYTLRDDKGGWLGTVILTQDGFFMSLTDYGNFAYRWGSIGMDDFRYFILSIDEDYFERKMVEGCPLIMKGQAVKKQAHLFAQRILPPLKEMLRTELKNEAMQRAVTKDAIDFIRLADANKEQLYLIAIEALKKLKNSTSNEVLTEK